MDHLGWFLLLFLIFLLLLLSPWVGGGRGAVHPKVSINKQDKHPPTHTPTPHTHLCQLPKKTLINSLSCVKNIDVSLTCSPSSCRAECLAVQGFIIRPPCFFYLFIFFLFHRHEMLKKGDCGLESCRLPGFVFCSSCCCCPTSRCTVLHSSAR